MSGTSIGHIPAGPWEFDQSVTSCFDDMLSRSIPQYDVMRSAVTGLARDYIAEGIHSLWDIGSSVGGTFQHIGAEHFPCVKFIGLEVSDSMYHEAEERFASVSNVSFVKASAPSGIASLRQRSCRPTVITSILTLQFIPIEDRQAVVQEIYDSLAPGGAFLLVEKILGSTASIDRQMVEHYYSFKRSSGYTQEEIDRKRFSLRGTMVPITSAWNVDMLNRAGFDIVDCFWRWMNFTGWIAVK